MSGIDIKAPIDEGFDQVLTDDALAFLGELHDRFDNRRRELLQRRAERRARFAAGELWKTHGRISEDLVRDATADAAGPAYELFAATALADEMPEFLTLPAYERLISANSR